MWLGTLGTACQTKFYVSNRMVAVAAIELLPHGMFVITSFTRSVPHLKGAL